MSGRQVRTWGAFTGRAVTKTIIPTSMAAWITMVCTMVEAALPIAHVRGPWGRIRTRSRAPPTRSV